MLAIWVSPIILFLGLVASRRVPAVMAALSALLLLASVVILAGPQTVTVAQFLMMFAAGAWIAFPAVLVILAGLYFTEILDGSQGGPSVAGTQGMDARTLGTTCLFLGPFVETTTGFGVGYVVAVGAVMRAGIGPAGALALGAFSQSLVPWGALGIGTTISASIAGISVDELGWRAAIIIAPLLWIMVALYWRIAAASGVEITRAQRIEDAACIAMLSVLLIAMNTIFPIELAGLISIAPVLLFRMARSSGRALASSSSLKRAFPYLLLMALLAATKLVPDIRAWLSTPAYTPGQGAPPFAPLASPAIPLVLAAVLGRAVQGTPRGLIAGLAPTATKGLRACILTILLVALAWIIVRAGIAEAFALALRGWAGEYAALAVPLLGALGGYLTGSNTGAGGLSMPVAQSIALDGGTLSWIAAAAIVAGSVFTAFSPVRFAMGQAIAKAGRADTRTALRMLIPFALATITVTVGAVLLSRAL